MSNDPQNIWQSQPTEEMKMPISLLLQKARQHRSDSRWLVAANDAGCAALVIFLAFTFARTPSAISRVGLVLIVAASIQLAYRRHRKLWPRPVAPDAPPPTGLEAYRRELQAWRDDAGSLGPLTPFIPGIAFFAYPGVSWLIRESGHPAILMNASPFLSLLAVWLVLIFPMRKRKLRKLQAEIDMLDALVR